MTTIRGKKSSTSYGRAGAFLKLQVPKIKETFPEFEVECYGTINVELERSLIVFNSDHRTPRIGNHLIDLVCVQLEVKGKMHEGWLSTHSIPLAPAFEMSHAVHDVSCLRETPQATCAILLVYSKVRVTNQMPYSTLRLTSPPMWRPPSLVQPNGNNCESCQR